MDWMLVIALIILFLDLFIPCSLYLLKNPLILHKKKKLDFYSRHISHRGGAGEKIENTMEAFTHAEEVGTQMLELDCHLTQDGYVMVSHDKNLKRQTGLDVAISSLKRKDLPLYKDHLEVTFNVGHYSTGKDRKMALLEDVFKKFPKMPINIEVKENKDELIEKCPSMPYSFTMGRIFFLLVLFYTGLLPFVPLEESLLQFYLPSVINRKYIPEESILKNRFVSAVGQLGLFVCNEESDMDAAFSVGATGVMSDYPALLSEYLKNHPLPPSTM
uniref:Glycerophosphodiester phosphodiesterase domain containing 3b n=1 Tax=Astyanax mexicanus TaxID=7994 RepID=A0A3B1J302_ASTMX